MKNILTVLALLLTFLSSACSEEEKGEVYELILDKSELNITIGEKSIINVLEAPAINEPIVWSSDNETVATVFYGNVTALSGGTAIVTATIGDYSAQCEVTVPVPEYQLVWEDNFDGTTLNTNNWTIEVNGNGGGNQELQYYTDRTKNVRVEDGCLVLEAHREEYQGKQYTSGRIISKNKQDFTYGKMEARLKVPKGKGTWPAFWMLGYGSWPRCGEIDIMEHVGYDPKILHCALHTQNKNGMNGKNVSGEQTLDNDVAEDFHVLTMEWVQNDFMGYDRIHIYVDGVKTTTFSETKQLQDSGDWPFNDRFFFILNLAIGGNWGGAHGIDDNMFNEPVLFKVDYVKVYQLK